MREASDESLQVVVYKRLEKRFGLEVTGALGAAAIFLGKTSGERESGCVVFGGQFWVEEEEPEVGVSEV